jgi:hypothetical protein
VIDAHLPGGDEGDAVGVLNRILIDLRAIRQRLIFGLAKATHDGIDALDDLSARILVKTRIGLHRWP